MCCHHCYIRLVWSGKVPIAFHLARSEVTSMEAPQPVFVSIFSICCVSSCVCASACLYLRSPFPSPPTSVSHYLSEQSLLSRCSYLPLVSSDLREQFMAFAPAREDEMWFEYKGVPLKWHIPVGVLFDMYAGAQDHRRDAALPWSITVHFQSFPEKKLQRCPTQECVRSMFAQSLKESSYLRFDSSKPVSSFTKSDHTDLWDSIMNDSFDKYSRVMSSLFQHADATDVSYPVRWVLQTDSKTRSHTIVQRRLPCSFSKSKSSCTCICTHMLRVNDHTRYRSYCSHHFFLPLHVSPAPHSPPFSHCSCSYDRA
jgi:Autophagy protein ATG5, UblA domain/Autophagy protein ATG5, alpha-helical bundle region